MKHESVRAVGERGLCCSCGACEVVCPQRAVRLEYDENGMFVPKVDEAVCNGCGICEKICPSGKMLVVPQRAEEPLASYSLYAIDQDLRWKCGSGGFVTVLILELLRQGKFKRAYVVNYDRFSGEQAKSDAVSSAQDVISAAKSKYIPVSVARVVEAIKANRIAESIVVCTPCQLKALKGAMAQYGVSEEGVLFVGLFCEQMLNYKVYEEYEKAFGSYDKLDFRDKEPNGWPADSTLIKNGVRRKIERGFRIALKDAFAAKCCQNCSDKLNVCADISVGDCYVDADSRMDGDRGLSSVIVRTEKGARAFSTCKACFDSYSTSYSVVAHSQGVELELPLKSSWFTVCLDIASLENRGDWLMFEAMLEQVRSRYPNAVVAVPEKVFLRNVDVYRRKKVLPCIIPFKRKDRLRIGLSRFLSSCTGMASAVCASDIDLLLFAPGFCFSDQFEEMSREEIDDECMYFNYFNKQGRRIVFMPQAFGPFMTDVSKLRVRRLVGIADLVYARDSVSLELLHGEVGQLDKIKVSPDFTAVFHEAGCELPFKGHDYVVLIPNAQMINRTKSAIGVNYRTFSVETIKWLLARGENVVLLNHEGDSDEELMSQFDQDTGRKCVKISNVSGGACKAVIAGSKLTITSRFHGLVSALTDGVSVLCTSWSHKYQTMTAELGSPKSCLDLTDVSAALAVVNDALLHPGDYTASQFKLIELRHQIHTMWDEIFADFPAANIQSVKPPRRRIYIPRRLSW